MLILLYPCILYRLLKKSFLLIIYNNMTTKTINGITFTVNSRLTPLRNYKTSIFDLYSRPSYTKIKIFNDWDKLINIYGLTGNSCTFTIYGDIVDGNGIKHNVKITKGYNYLID